MKSTNALRLELATILANGGRTFVGDLQYNSGMPDPEVIKRIGEEYALLPASNRKSVGSWIGRLQYSLQKEGRRPEAFERLASALTALPD